MEPRGHERYEKPPLNADQLLQRWQERGLSIPDEERAKRYFSHIGYYRLTPYGIPFRQVLDGKLLEDFKADTSFDDVLSLYVFDRKLRLIVFDAIERIEVAVRAAITDTMSTLSDDPFWYVRKDLFNDVSRHNRLLSIVREACDGELKRRSSGEAETLLNYPGALRHYLTKYGEPELPPSWITLESLTLGQLESLYSNLRQRRHRSQIAEVLGIKEPLMASWLRSFLRVRNICGHHGRLWNAWLGSYPKLPQSPDVRWLHQTEGMPAQWEKRLYPVLAAMQTVLFTISPHSTWATRLHDHMSTSPAPLAAMGIPQDWWEDPFWHRE